MERELPYPDLALVDFPAHWLSEYLIGLGFTDAVVQVRYPTNVELGAVWVTSADDPTAAVAAYDGSPPSGEGADMTARTDALAALATARTALEAVVSPTAAESAALQLAILYGLDQP